MSDLSSSQEHVSFTPGYGGLCGCGLYVGVLCVGVVSGLGLHSFISMGVVCVGVVSINMGVVTAGWGGGGGARSHGSDNDNN